MRLKDEFDKKGKKEKRHCCPLPKLNFYILENFFVHQRIKLQGRSVSLACRSKNY
jgi:hypothetical protein